MSCKKQEAVRFFHCLWCWYSLSLPCNPYPMGKGHSLAFSDVKFNKMRLKWSLLF